MKRKDKTRVEKKGQGLQKPGRHHVEGVSERVDWVLKKYGVTTAIRPHTILRCLLVHPKDKVEPEEQGERHTRFNKIEQEMASGQGSHWLIKSPKCCHLCVTRPPEICVNLVLKHSHAASSYTICR